MKYKDGKEFFIAKANCFTADQLDEVSEILSHATEEQLEELNKKIKSPAFMTLLALFLGCFGIDRFMMGDMVVGFYKLITCGGLGFLTLYDACTTASRVREKNFQAILSLT